MQQTNNGNPSKELVTFANDLMTAAQIEPLQLVPVAPDGYSETVEMVFFQRYFRNKKVTETTGKKYQSLVTETVLKPVESSFDEENDIYTEFEEVQQPKIVDEVLNGVVTGKKVKAFKMRSGVNVVELKEFPFGNRWKIQAFFKPDEGDKLNVIIGRAVAKFRELLHASNYKGLNTSQPVYIAVPLAEGLVISNYQIWGAANKAKGLQAKHMKQGGNESEFAKESLSQFNLLINRMQAKELSICADWKELTIAFPSIKNLQRFVKK